MQQIANQLNKLVDVVSTEDMTGGEHLERELVLLKLKIRPERTDAVRGYVVRTGGRVLDPAADGFIVELTASEVEINTFVSDLAQQAELLEVVRLLEEKIGKKAIRELVPMQPGDVPATYADVDDLMRDVDFKPATPIADGIGRFIEWYRSYHHIV